MPTPPAVDLAALRRDALAHGLVALGDDFVVPVDYDVDAISLRADAPPRLEALAEWLRAHPEILRFTLGVHIQPIGTVARQSELTDGRARAVARWLVEHGVDCRRIVPIGYGATRPVADGSRELQRRTEIHFLELRGALPTREAWDRSRSACP